MMSRLPRNCLLRLMRLHTPQSELVQQADRASLLLLLYGTGAGCAGCGGGGVLTPPLSDPQRENARNAYCFFITLLI